MNFPRYFWPDSLLDFEPTAIVTRAPGFLERVKRLRKTKENSRVVHRRCMQKNTHEIWKTCGIVNVINVSAETKRPPLLSYRLFRAHTSYPEKGTGSGGWMEKDDERMKVPHFFFFLLPSVAQNAPRQDFTEGRDRERK